MNVLEHPAATPGHRQVLSWVHLGDLHASEEDGWQSLRELRAMVSQVNALEDGSVDFVFLPGDNANHGTLRQYQLIERCMAESRLPWHVVPGDHDVEQGDLSRFYAGLHAHTLPYSVILKGRRCLFLDIVSAGKGGPEFRLGAGQSGWLRKELESSLGDPEHPIVFMHALPADLAEGGEALARLLARHGVLCVDTGHTHYNEVINDGSVIYSATRSTGQAEEGGVGFSVHAVDGSAVSWRFKESSKPWPLVLVTSPADRRMVAGPTPDTPCAGPGVDVRAKVFGPGIQRVSLKLDDQAAIAMQALARQPGMWTARLAGVSDGEHRVRVIAEDRFGNQDADTVTVILAGGGPESAAELRDDLGHDRHTIGAWPEHGLLGSRLGPNRNGRKW